MNKGLKIKRAKDKPFTYNYELELIGINDKSNTYDPLFGSKGLGDFLDGCQKIVADIEKGMETIEYVVNAIETLTQQIVEAKKFAEKLQNGDDLQNAETIIRRFPGGNSLWNTVKSLFGTASKLQYLAGTSTSQTGGGISYSRDDYFSVLFNSGAGSYVSPFKVSFGNYAAEPDAPFLNKFKFLGWYTAAVQGELFNFDTTEITQNITLYARWEQDKAIKGTHTFLDTFQPYSVQFEGTVTF